MNFIKRCKSISRNQRGGILSLTAIMMPVLILVASLVVDLGVLYLGQTKASLAAVAAVEAAEQRLPDIASAKTLARQVALSMIDDSGFVSDYAITVNATTTTVSVEVDLRMKTVLAHFADVKFLDTNAVSARPLN